MASPPPPAPPAPARRGPAPSPSRDFRNLASTKAEEDAYNFFEHRKNIKLTGLIGSIAHVVKGALGGGILSGHVAYMKIGNIFLALSMNVFFGIYMCMCLLLLVESSQILYRRTRIPVMSYADVGEASVMCFHNEKVASWSKAFRYFIDFIICLDLFGSCCCYQIIIAKSIKQLVEDVKEATFEPAHEGYPSLRMYLAIALPFVILICLVRHLKYLAPFSIVANLVILYSIGMTINYAFQLNPNFENVVRDTTAWNLVESLGMLVFSMSCSGVVIPVENNMAEPHKFRTVIIVGMALIIMCTSSISSAGYTAFGTACEAPITLNFPMTLMPKILKGFVAFMIYVTHGLNFWVPFNLCWYYMKKKYPPEKQLFWELTWRAVFVVIIGLVGIIFPDINALMGFIGCFCLSNMAFIWPNVICLLVIWKRPGLGASNWRLWRGILFLAIGFFIFICGSMVTFTELVAVFIDLNVK